MLQIDTSMQDTTHRKFRYLANAQLDIGVEIRPGSRSWVHRAMQVRLATHPDERSLAWKIIKTRHYLRRNPVPPKTKFVSYLTTFSGIRSSETQAAGVAIVALLANNFHALPFLNAGLSEDDPAWIHPCSVLSLVRMWRADDLTPTIAPDFTPEMLRRIVRGEKHIPACAAVRGDSCDCSALGPIRDVWTAYKVNGGLSAEPKILFTYADPSVGHDGNTYISAGASFCGVAKNGKLLFAWALTEHVKSNLKAYSVGVRDRLESEGWIFNPFPKSPERLSRE